MGAMDVLFERQQAEEAQLAMTCRCGPCHPTATFYRDDPHYERHDPHLAEGPRCCGRFFVVGHDRPTAQARAKGMVSRLQEEGGASGGYDLRHQQVALPWGVTIEVISADLVA